MGQGNSLSRSSDRDRTVSQRQANNSDASDHSQRSGVRRLRRTSSCATTKHDYKRPCAAHPADSANKPTKETSGLTNSAGDNKQDSEQEQISSAYLNTTNDLDSEQSTRKDIDEEIVARPETNDSNVPSTRNSTDAVRNFRELNESSANRGILEATRTIQISPAEHQTSPQEDTVTGSTAYTRQVAMESSNSPPNPVNFPVVRTDMSIGERQYDFSSERQDDLQHSDAESDADVFYDADADHSGYMAFDSHAHAQESIQSNSSHFRNFNGFSLNNQEQRLDRSESESSYDDFDFAPQNRRLGEVGSRNLIPSGSYSNSANLASAVDYGDSTTDHSTYGGNPLNFPTSRVEAPGGLYGPRQPDSASLLSRFENTAETNGDSDYQHGTLNMPNPNEISVSAFNRYPNLRSSYVRRRSIDRDSEDSMSNFERTSEQNENPFSQNHTERHTSMSSNSTQNNTSTNEAEEDRLVSQLSRTLFTAVLLIASHAVNTANAQRAPEANAERMENNETHDSRESRDNGSNFEEERSSVTARPGESFREEVTRRIWNALHEHATGHQSTPSNPVYSQSNLSRLEEIRTSNGESFLTFMDQLWDGSLNRELSSALGGSDAFFRIFRFPRDSDNRFPVLVLRVTSVIDRNPFQQSPEDSNDNGETLSQSGDSIIQDEPTENGGSTSSLNAGDFENQIPVDNEEGDDSPGSGDRNSETRRFTNSPRRTEIAANESAHNDRRHNLFDDVSSDSEDELFGPNNASHGYFADVIDGLESQNEPRGSNWNLRRHAGGYAGHQNAWLEEASSAIRRERDRRVHLEGLAMSQREREEANARRRAEARANAERARQSETTQNNGNSRPNRSWITYVVRGSFPETHPIFSAPSLMTNHPTEEDMELLDQLFSPGKSPAASQEDIDHAGGVYNVANDSELLGERCPVCLVEYEEGDTCRSLRCSHSFHKDCVDSWLLRSHNSCPMCRQEGVPLHMREHPFSSV